MTAKDDAVIDLEIATVSVGLTALLAAYYTDSLALAIIGGVIVIGGRIWFGGDRYHGGARP